MEEAHQGAEDSRMDVDRNMSQSSKVDYDKVDYYYSAQLFLRMRLNAIHGSLYGTSCKSR